MSRRELAEVLRTADHCHGIVTRDGEQDACGKPPVAIIDWRGTEAETYWPVCAYHAHRYGDGRAVPLRDILAAHEAREARVRALADEWEHRYDAGDHMVGCPDGAGYYDLLADELRAALDGGPA
jgi:hypothetical protein